MFIAAVQNSLVNFSAVKIDTTDIFIFAGIILAAIGAIWGIRKMIVLGYISSVPGHWQKKYDREQDLADYKEFRDSGGFEDGRFGFDFGNRAYRFNGFNSDSEDDSEGEYIGSVGDKSWYYDKEGNVYSSCDEIDDAYYEYIEGDEDEYVSVYISYEDREEHRERLMDYIDNKQEFESEWERVERHNEWDEIIDSEPYYGKDGDIYSGHEEQGGYDDIRIGWEK